MLRDNFNFMCGIPGISEIPGMNYEEEQKKNRS